ncbi:Protein kinase-like domain [Pseudocohnilembus persalinus]|uniref:Protein kinase-like domain n=1 Tax=Pseudocohnilembus persalinus TaxID=266149 RepID=A0A0V0R8W9_PSEPJ|nr:Protein kinase-like domain [Pseudocohnilembus persalinus]|eukprot:KRX10882.1 Protein kinase-like domain [Pseudocohnilembus persalinus]
MEFLIKYIEKLGFPEKKNWENGYEFLRSRNVQLPSQNEFQSQIENTYKKCTVESLKVIFKMVIFNPELRWSSEQLLKYWLMQNQKEYYQKSVGEQKTQITQDSIDGQLKYQDILKFKQFEENSKNLGIMSSSISQNDWQQKQEYGQKDTNKQQKYNENFYDNLSISKENSLQPSLSKVIQQDSNDSGQLEMSQYEVNEKDLEIFNQYLSEIQGYENEFDDTSNQNQKLQNVKIQDYVTNFKKKKTLGEFELEGLEDIICSG